MNTTKLTISNGLKSIVIGGFRPYLLSKPPEGLSALEADERVSESANIDGSVYKDSVLNIRDIKISITIKADRYDDLLFLKDEVIQVCNPKSGLITLDIESGNIIRTIQVVADSVPNLDLRSNSLTSDGEINLIAHQPWLLSKIELGEILNISIGGWQTAFSFPVSFATRGENIKNVLNNGHVSTPVVIDISGHAINPIITNTTTGEYIKILKEIEAEEILRITTEQGNKRVEIIKSDGSIESAFNYIDINSTFFELQVGDNILEYSSDEIEPNNVTVSYRLRYLGM